MAGETANQGIEGENDPASAVEVEVAVATTAAYGGAGEGALATGACGGMGKNRLPYAEVQYILSWERREFAPDTSNMSEEEVEIMRRAVQASNVLNNNFAEYQAEVRDEYGAKGYVEVEDDYFEYREEKRQFIREQLADLFDNLDFSDGQEEEQQKDEDYYNNESKVEGEAEMSPESKFE